MASLKDEVDVVSRQSGLGELTAATANALYGINHRGVGNPIPYNTDNHGLTFFTRPRMNLSYDNLSVDRVLTPLLVEKEDPPTLQRAIRVLLDPINAGGRFGFNSRRLTKERLNPVTSPLVDHKSAFIALLTNNLLSLNGWPDPVVGFYNAKEGVHKESWSMVDDVVRYYGTFDLQASFRNIAGDPITLLFNTWIRYAANVYEGRMIPYPDSILENEIDYQTRIYRLILDPSRQFVQKIAVANAAFPTSSALGAAFNFASDTPFVQDTAQQISIPLHCVGAEYNDPITIREFNDVVGVFNNDMFDHLRPNKMMRLDKALLNYFNYNGYPRIDPRTQELQWWVSREDYTNAMRLLEAGGPLQGTGQ